MRTVPGDNVTGILKYRTGLSKQDPSHGKAMGSNPATKVPVLKHRIKICNVDTLWENGENNQEILDHMSWKQSHGVKFKA